MSDQLQYPDVGLFVRKPVVMHAARWFKLGDHPEDDMRVLEGEHGAVSKPKVVTWLSTAHYNMATPCKHCGLTMREHGWIETLEGGHIVCPGDYIVTGTLGERWPVKPQAFYNTYQPHEVR